MKILYLESLWSFFGDISALQSYFSPTGKDTFATKCILVYLCI